MSVSSYRPAREVLGAGSVERKGQSVTDAAALSGDGTVQQMKRIVSGGREPVQRRWF